MSLPQTNSFESSGPVLITGTTSGLGRFLGEHIAHEAINEDTTQSTFDRLADQAWGTIIHCAFNHGTQVDDRCLFPYVRDNIWLGLKLASFRHRRFVYVSSVDVYPPGMGQCVESEPLSLDASRGLYATTKLMSEAVVKELCSGPLVLRCSAMLGIHTRRNALIRMMDNETDNITLSGDSTFNYVLHSDVIEFLARAIEMDLTGVYNLASSGNIALRAIADMFGREVSFGEFLYVTGNIDNGRARSVCGAFDRTSEENIVRFVEERGRV